MLSRQHEMHVRVAASQITDMFEQSISPPTASTKVAGYWLLYS